MLYHAQNAFSLKNKTKHEKIKKTNNVKASKLTYVKHHFQHKKSIQSGNYDKMFSFIEKKYVITLVSYSLTKKSQSYVPAFVERITEPCSASWVVTPA